MKGKVRIDGVYDLKTIRFLEEIGIDEYGLDFRPKSFNFIPEHQFLEIMESTYSHHKRYFLLFSAEKEFVVKKIVEDLQMTLLKANIPWPTANIFLDLSDMKDPKFCLQLGVPFFIRITPDTKNLTDFLTPMAKGIIIDFEHLKMVEKNGGPRGGIDSFIQGIHEDWQKRIGRHARPELALNLDWFQEGILNHWDSRFDFKILPINNKVEYSYRRVNYQKMKIELKREFLPKYI